MNVIEKMRQNPHYGLIVPLTVNLHRFEHLYQDFSQPRIILRKELDDEGFTVKFDVNEPYEETLRGGVDALVQDINDRSQYWFEKALDWLDEENTYGKLRLMAAMDETELEVYSTLKARSPDQAQAIDRMPHVILRHYDHETGIPVAYELNQNIKGIVDLVRTILPPEILK